MNFVQSISTVYSKYFVFSGRAIRSEFWWYMLFQTVISVALFFVPVLGMVWNLANLVPIVAVTSRRLHDIDGTAWWQLLPLVGLPVVLIGLLFSSSIMMMVGGGMAGIAYLVILYWAACDGTPGPNHYGKDPLRREGDGTYE